PERARGASRMRIVVVGAGPAGFRAAEVLRQLSAEAEITLVGDEPHPPYQRPPLSKEFITKGQAPGALYLQPTAFYEAQRIALRLGSAAVAIDRGAREVALADGTRLPYDRLLLATGCRGRLLPPALAEVPVAYLRSLADAEAIRARLRPGLEVVLVGGGFI